MYCSLVEFSLVQRNVIGAVVVVVVVVKSSGMEWSVVYCN